MRNEFKQTLKKLARNNRKKVTRAEALMWNMVLSNNRLGYRFLRQKIKMQFILDFYCPKLKLAIEIDGSSHNNREYNDQERDNLLGNIGVKTIRYTNNQVENQLENVFEDIKKQIIQRLKEINN